MEQLHDRCCGVDVHQAELTAWFRLVVGKRLDEHVQNFGTTTPDLMALRDWLSAHRYVFTAGAVEHASRTRESADRIERSNGS